MMISISRVFVLSKLQTDLAVIWANRKDALAQSVERTNPGGEILGSIPAVAARSLLVGSVSV